MVQVGNFIEKWVKIVNKEYGLSRRNKYSMEYFKALAELNGSIFIFKDNYYLVCYIGKNMWGYKSLHVVSYYILPEYRSLKTFMKIQNEIEALAKKYKVRYILQGSHLNDKLNNVLPKMGYTCESFKKEI